MKAKAYAIALIAAICYSSLVCIKAHADVSADSPEYKDWCIEVKYQIIEVIEVMEFNESMGVVIPDEYVENVLGAALFYSKKCGDVTGELYEEEY